MSGEVEDHDAGRLITPASLWRRHLAQLLDLGAALLLWGVFLLVGLFNTAPLHPPPGWFWSEWLVKHMLDQPEALWKPLLTLAILLWCWHIVWHALVGRSPGGALLGLRVVDRRTGDALPLPHTIARLALMGLTIPTLGLSALWTLASRHRRAWHDILTRAVVIHAPHTTTASPAQARRDTRPAP